jgi:hypothetical protein
MIVPAGCKKYPEGPGLSLRAKKKRLINHWQTVYLIHHPTGEETPEPTERLVIRDDNTFARLDSGGYIIYQGEWVFDEDKTHVLFNYEFVGQDYTRSEQILLLKNKTLWLMNVSDSTERHFEPAEG